MFVMQQKQKKNMKAIPTQSKNSRSTQKKKIDDFEHFLLYILIVTSADFYIP